MDRPSSVPWPPILYLIAIGVAWYLGTIMPLTWFSAIVTDAWFIVGLFMFLGGLALDFYALRTLHKHNTTVMPTKGSDHLVTSGPYAISRNPIYVGNTVLTMGLGVIFSNGWFFVTAIVAAIATNYLQIRPEEKHLSASFGTSWLKYKKKVRRWI